MLLYVVGHCVAYPRCNALAHALLEGIAECAVTMVATLVGQLLDGEWALRTDCLLIELYEMIDAEAVDVGIVVHAVT